MEKVQLIYALGRDNLKLFLKCRDRLAPHYHRELSLKWQWHLILIMVSILRPITLKPKCYYCPLVFHRWKDSVPGCRCTRTNDLGMLWMELKVPTTSVIAEERLEKEDDICSALSVSVDDLFLFRSSVKKLGQGRAVAACAGLGGSALIQPHSVYPGISSTIDMEPSKGPGPIFHAHGKE
ncbi:hypothetical protein PAL_GLEAN10017111 [Pteropus alecto]|uniref:Uncharacterized protein n=1 Tax=Pteropus alecto TaxID=9402 RepID=L5KHC8_PTEAL|nr:hypothetical protein PAL_GLEAN10017111 [Pteropus alecto]